MTLIMTREEFHTPLCLKYGDFGSLNMSRASLAVCQKTPICTCFSNGLTVDTQDRSHWYMLWIAPQSLLYTLKGHCTYTVFVLIKWKDNIFSPNARPPTTLCARHWWIRPESTFQYIYVLSSYLNSPVAGVSSRLNSATVTPRSEMDGANMAAGYTTDEVPTYRNDYTQNMVKYRPTKM